MWHGWIIIRDSDNAVVGTQYDRPPAGAWGNGYTVHEVRLPTEPPIHDPAGGGIESHDPSTADDRMNGLRIDFDQLAEDVQTETEWLNVVIPLIATADLMALRVVLERMARQNQGMLRAWRYILRRMEC